MKKPHKVI